MKNIKSLVKSTCNDKISQTNDIKSCSMDYQSTKGAADVASVMTTERTTTDICSCASSYSALVSSSCMHRRERRGQRGVGERRGQRGEGEKREERDEKEMGECSMLKKHEE